MGRYSDLHAKHRGPGDACPTAFQIIQDDDLQGHLKAGIGLETARALSATGATLFFNHPEPGRVSLVPMDNASLASVEAAAATILALSQNQVNFLVCNAAILGVPERQITIDGYEMHFAVTYLSHFFLFELLKPACSQAHPLPTLLECPADNYRFEKGGYERHLAYAHSKLATKIKRRCGSKELYATSVHPGTILTNLFDTMINSHEQIKQRIKTCEQGAATTLLAAVGYLEDCREAGPAEDDNDVLGQRYVQQTYDPYSGARLWQDSLKMVSMEDV
ncbi:hypothetical protein BDV10DRAFT_200685 [Aspergillus recurvatus]